MSHVDEGLLHAYLDGALDDLPAAEAQRVRSHLAGCDVCRERLQEERAVRDEASRVLGRALPDLGELPSLEDLRSRAGRRSRGARLERLAWAASVVLALGTGWMLRGGPVATDAGGPLSPAVLQERQALLRSSTGVPEELRVVDDAVPEEKAGPAPAESSGAAEVVLEAPVEATLEARADAPAPRGAGAVEAERAPSDSGVTSSAAPSNLWRQSLLARERRAQEPARAADVSDRQPVSIAPTPAAPPAALQRREVVSKAALTGAAPAARALDEGESLLVPGLPVLGVSRLQVAGTGGAVRVLQLLADGDTLELTHVPAEGGAAPFAAPDDGRTQVVVPVGGGWLVVRAHQSAEVLSDLVSRIRDGG